MATQYTAMIYISASEHWMMTIGRDTGHQSPHFHISCMMSLPELLDSIILQQKKWCCQHPVSPNPHDPVTECTATDSTFNRPCPGFKP
eukprot:12945434-Ditylum_brightwellii.AAC.1